MNPETNKGFHKRPARGPWSDLHTPQGTHFNTNSNSTSDPDPDVSTYKIPETQNTPNRRKLALKIASATFVAAIVAGTIANVVSNGGAVNATSAQPTNPDDNIEKLAENKFHSGLLTVNKNDLHLRSSPFIQKDAGETNSIHEFHAGERLAVSFYQAHDTDKQKINHDNGDVYYIETTLPDTGEHFEGYIFSGADENDSNFQIQDFDEAGQADN